MEKIQYMTMTKNPSSNIETSILSAHEKYFKGNSETVGSLNGAESVLYDVVRKYFRGNS